jgi:glycosyltransferase involved in cell wall biosynthesis
MTEISVVIPTCDRPNTLMEAVNCVLGQSYPAHEIIVVNNGGHRLNHRQLPKKVSVYELPPFVGVSRARNHGTTLATGDYVAFLDDDDLWETDYLDKVATVIEEHHPDCIITRLDKMVDGKISPYKNAENKLDLSTLLVSNPGIGGQTTIVRRESFFRISGYDTKLKTSEDKALIIEFLINGYSVMTAPQIQAILREHGCSRLRNAESMFEGISGFKEKYGKLMSPSQRNLNLVKIYYYRFLARRHALDYLLFWMYFLLNSFYRRVDTSLPNAPMLPLSIKR